ncbi:MAG: GDP-mannose 4,6-dehydratase [Nitrospinaceae bacterium]
MKNLITGIQGFAGSHLADLLLAHNEEVIGLARSLENDRNIRHARDRIEVMEGDIRSPEEVIRCLETVRPSRIYHLAAVTFVPAGEEDCQKTFETNFYGTLHLLNAVKKMGLKTRILWVGSSEAYGVVTREEGPIREDRPLKPFSLYGVSKAAADLLAQSYFERDGLDIVRVRPFNHIGPRQSSNFACSSFARQVVEIENGAPPVLQTGNLDSWRDILDVRDTVRAYRAIMERGTSGAAYNVCSGKETRVRALLEALVKMSRIPIRIQSDPARFRLSKSINVYGDSTHLREQTGWRPRIPLEKTLEDILEYWRETLKSDEALRAE